jgi:ribosomal protein S18 acetylase RimI-like enzyme
VSSIGDAHGTILQCGLADINSLRVVRSVDAARFGAWCKMCGVVTLLDNIIWNCLSGPHAHFAAGSGPVRRYAPGFSPIVGCEDPHHPDFTTLANYCEPGESFYVDIWSGPESKGWRIDKEATMIKMIWDAPTPKDDAAPDAILLKPEHAAQAVELTRITNPGPFGIRTPELGEYFGYFDSGRLIALAGERMSAGDLHEVSGICTHPDFQGRGLAKKLTLKLVRRQLQRGKTPFLHVMSHNTPARALYAKMGFRDYLETVVRVVTRM